MWELIRQNKRRSLILFIVMGICLILLGYLVGAAFAPPNGGIGGIVLALVVWGFLSLISYFNGDSIMLSISGAKEVTPDVHPRLFNVVEEMKIAAGLPKMPKVYIIDDPTPNAFATGRRPEKASIAVTAGLLARMNRDELQGVVAHETGHILNRDVQFVTFAGIMLGAVTLISYLFLRGLWFSGGTGRRYRSRSSSSGGGQAQLIILVAALVFAILAPILTQLLYYAISRKREYLADATAARLTRYPEGLASALEKISTSTGDMQKVNKVTAPMYIVNPLKKKGARMSDLTSTHPPITRRIQILRAMSQGAGLAEYQHAFNQTTGSKSSLIPGSELKGAVAVPLRKAGEGGVETAKAAQRKVGDLMRAVNKFAFVYCTCGLKIKIPPDFKKESLACPRCGHEVKVPSAELATAAAVLGTLDASSRTGSEGGTTDQHYKRKSKDWESFACSCGQLLQLSPDFKGSEITCSNCGRKTIIDS
jgi:heat shock protein HtpX